MIIVDNKARQAMEDAMNHRYLYTLDDERKDENGLEHKIILRIVYKMIYLYSN
jgi:hypothetical protein